MTRIEGKYADGQGFNGSNCTGERRLTLLVVGIGVAAVLIGAGPAPAQPIGPLAQTATGEARIAFDIPAQPLESAVTAFGFQSGYQVAVDQATLTGLRGNEVRGSFTPVEALSRLLAGTGVAYRLVDENSVTLVAASPGRTDDDVIQLNPVKVEGRSESAYGPVAGYVAKRSATATKTDTLIIDTPASIKVVPRDVIEDQNATRLSDVLRNVSGVQAAVTNGNRFDLFFVRGFSPSGLGRDGLLASRAFGEPGFVDLANVERVEVLKGPASVLYGSGDLGGIINIVSKRPQPDAFYEASGTYGRFDYYRGELDFNQPLTADGKLLARLNVAYQDSGSFRDRFRDTERFHIAPSLNWTPTARTSVVLQTEYYEQDTPFDRGIIAIDGDFFALPRERYFGGLEDRTKADELRVQMHATHEFSDDWAASVKARVSDSKTDRRDVTLASLVKADGRTADRSLLVSIQEYWAYGIDANLTGKLRTGPLEHEVLFGSDTHLTSFESTADRATASPVDVFDPVNDGRPFGPPVPLPLQERKVDTYGFYGQDIISLGERWKLLLGGRYDIAKTQFSFDDNALSDKTDREFTGRAGVVFKPLKDLSLYASYTESFLPPLSGRTADGADFKPTTGVQYEAGVKRDWLDGRLSTTLAVFEITRQNVTTSDPNNFGFSIQVGEQRSRGAELDIAGELLPGWQVIGGLAYLDTEITRDNSPIEGNKLASTPEWSGSIWTSYAFQNETLRGLELGGGVFAVGRREADLQNNLSVPGYTRVDLFARYDFNEHVSFSANVQNLFDSEYIEAVRRVGGEPGAPLTVFGTLNLRF